MISEHRLKSIAINSALCFSAVLMCNMAAHTSEAARILRLSEMLWADRLFDLGVGTAIVLFGFLAVNLIRGMLRTARRYRRMDQPTLSDSGTIAVEFALVFPVIFLIMGMIFQLALLANGALVVRYATFAAARSAIVHTSANPVESQTDAGTRAYNGNIRKAAWLVLASISPRKQQTSSTDQSVVALRRILSQQRGVWGDRNIQKRYNYARRATRLTLETSFSKITAFTGLGNVESPVPNLPAPKYAKITIEYPFLLTIPGVGMIPGISTQAPLGVRGRVFWIKRRVYLQGAGARENWLGMANPNASMRL